MLTLAKKINPKDLEIKKEEKLSLEEATIFLKKIKDICTVNNLHLF